MLAIEGCLLLTHPPPVVGVAFSSKQEVELWVFALFLHCHLLKLCPISGNKHCQLVNNISNIRVCTRTRTYTQ